jgi:beta-aspartyl-peptidase (threonine type)
MKYSIAIHGGAGTISRRRFTPDKQIAYYQVLAQAIKTAENLLANGGTALAAVEAAVIILEDCPLFNAGKGAVFTNEGKHEMDASIMTGHDLEAGAIAFVHGVRNPIRLARAVMEQSEHVFLCGTGAEQFARKVGLPFEPESYFFTQDRYTQLLKAQKEDTIQLDHSENDSPKNDPLDKKHGTVGAVALDSYGNVAAATSTGGLTNKKFGRIGDSSIIGAGTYANNLSCAVSCTGYGEFYIRGVVAYDVSCLMEYKGLSLDDACQVVINDKQVKMGSDGGLIAVDAQGNVCLSYNSEGMYRAYKRHNSPLFVAVFDEELRID